MDRTRIVIVGAGFAGYEAARTLSRLAGRAAEIVLINATDYFLYLPLLPEVACGVLDPRRITVSLSQHLPGVRVVLGSVDGLDLDARRVSYTDPEGGTGDLAYDKLIITVGSVNKLLPVPGIAEHAHGFRGISEAVYLRDHIARQFELAATTDDPAERAARTTFVVVGAGYTGTEVAAQGIQYTDALARQHAGLSGTRPRWLLLDLADRVLPELDPRLSGDADRVLRERGVDVRMGTSIEEAYSGGVRLTDGTHVANRTLVWCVGVRPDPLVENLGLATQKGRLVVDEYLGVPGHPELFAAGDAAAVPDLTRPGETTPMTAQHAVRQGKRVARNVAASYGRGRRKPYKHKDLGFVVDLGGFESTANPLGLHLSGLPARAVTRGYHLLSLPGNRVRVAAEWALEAVLPRQAVQLGLIRGPQVPLETTTPTPRPTPRAESADRSSAPSGGPEHESTNQ